MDNEKSEEGGQILLIEQYAERVLDFSSQYGSDDSYSYTAFNCLGTPSKFPAYGKELFIQKEFIVRICYHLSINQLKSGKL